MFKLSGLILSLISISFITLPATAQSFDDGRDSAAYAGLYMSVPLASQRTAHTKDFKFGFKAGLRQDIRYTKNGLVKTSTYTADMLDLNFSEQGFNKLSLAGTPLIFEDYAGQIQYMDGDEGGSSNTILWVAGGILVLGAVAVAALCFKSIDGSEKRTC